MALIKIGGIVAIGIAALWVGGITFASAADTADGLPLAGFTASVALSILAFKGFTTITNNGSETVNPH